MLRSDKFFGSLSEGKQIPADPWPSESFRTFGTKCINDIAIGHISNNPRMTYCVLFMKQNEAITDRIWLVRRESIFTSSLRLMTELLAPYEEQRFI